MGNESGRIVSQEEVDIEYGKQIVYLKNTVVQLHMQIKQLEEQNRRRENEIRVLQSCILYLSRPFWNPNANSGAISPPHHL